MEHKISQRSTGFDLFMKEAARQDSSTAKIPKNSLAFSIQSILENGLIPGERKATKDGRPFSSFHLTLVVETPMKKNSVTITQLLKTCTTTVIGNVTRMQFIGEFSPEHKIKDWNSGRRSHTPSSYTVLCRQIASTKPSLKTEIVHCSNDSQPHDPRQKSH